MQQLLALLLLLSSLCAETFFEQAKIQFDDGNHSAAYPLFVQAYEVDADEEAAFYLGQMAEYGIGAAKDMNASHHWYRRASVGYRAIVNEAIDYDLDKQRRLFVKGIDMNDTEAKTTLERKILSMFGLKAHRANYFLPTGYSTFDYRSYVPSDRYSRYEAELQLSLGFDLFDDLLGLGEIYSVAYTQRSFWQIYVASKPFRETNYNPEFIITLPRNDKFGIFSLTALTFSFAHQSNGQGNITEQEFYDINLTQSALPAEHPEWLENHSRSWNYVTASAIFQYRSLFLRLTGWARIPENPESDDNPELLDYLGYGSLRLYYPNGKSLYSMLLRHNFSSGKGAVEATWSYPFFERSSTYWYVKLFSGYGESLIDYNHHLNKFAAGLSFSR